MALSAMQRNKLHIRKGDKVVVLSGKSKGKEGKVIEVSTDERKVIVEGVNVVKKHVKPRRQGQEGGIVEVESALYACKVMAVCPKCHKPTRLAHVIEKAADKTKKFRACKHCGAKY